MPSSSVHSVVGNKTSINYQTYGYQTRALVVDAPTSQPTFATSKTTLPITAISTTTVVQSTSTPVTTTKKITTTTKGSSRNYVPL
ncbi:hypothetical protein CAEBREN_31840, partial [Caenorhabditis brenneri]